MIVCRRLDDSGFESCWTESLEVLDETGGVIVDEKRRLLLGDKLEDDDGVG